ncbi:MAG: efflux RND transporter periplasmic adaptor subunit [Myxococcales bacterium]|nr:efflux RND transporter periplasmic adaptor subunit [Myxococcales bacterium]
MTLMGLPLYRLSRAAIARAIPNRPALTKWTIRSIFDQEWTTTSNILSRFAFARQVSATVLNASENQMKRLSLILTAFLLVSACGGEDAAPPPPPPSNVSVMAVTAGPSEEILDFSGQVQPSRTVQVRAQVAGVILERPFREGALVQAGDVLYRVERTVYAAEYRSARARQVQAEAQLSNASASAARLRRLLEDNAVARQDVDDAETAVAQGRAMVDEARGAVDGVRKNLDETIIRAEITGRVGRALLDVGTRVSGPADVLTTIDVIDPVYVSFRPSAEQQFRWKREPALRAAVAPGGSARVQAILPDSSAVAQTGRIGYIDPVVDPQTGTQEYRAEFTNRDGLLLPGQFVRVHLLGLFRPDVILVPQRAVLQQMGRQVVYVVNAENKVESRDVSAKGWSGTRWLIEKGLASGERVVVDGVQKIGPGALVKPTAVAADGQPIKARAQPIKTATSLRLAPVVVVASSDR